MPSSACCYVGTHYLEEYRSCCWNDRGVRAVQQFWIFKVLGFRIWRCAWLCIWWGIQQHLGKHAKSTWFLLWKHRAKAQRNNQSEEWNSWFREFELIHYHKMGWFRNDDWVLETIRSDMGLEEKIQQVSRTAEKWSRSPNLTRCIKNTSRRNLPV